MFIKIYSIFKFSCILVQGKEFPEMLTLKNNNQVCFENVRVISPRFEDYIS